MGLEGVLDETEAADEIGVTPGTLANWRWRGHGPPYLKIGRKVTYLRNDVDRWKLSQRHDPAQAAS